MAKRKELVNEFPKMLYKYPSVSKNNCELQDGIYDISIIENVNTEDEMLANGWFITSPEAKLNSLGDITKDEIEKDKDNTPATREELEQKAAELGIKFLKETTDEGLLKLIESKLSWK